MNADDDVIRSLTVRLATLEKIVRDNYQYLDVVTSKLKKRVARLEEDYRQISNVFRDMEEDVDNLQQYNDLHSAKRLAGQVDDMEKDVRRLLSFLTPR
jgi:myosin heavy subunit